MTYRARAGVNWRTADGNEERAEVGEPVPAWVVEGCPWLLRVGAVEEAPGSPGIEGAAVEAGAEMAAPTRAPARRKGHSS